MLLKRIFPVALTIAIGWLVLISFLPLDRSNPLVASLVNVRTLLIEWALILAAFALLLGYLNLIAIHIRRVRQGESILYSIVLIVSSWFVLGLWGGSVLRALQAGLPLQNAIRGTDSLDGVFNLIIAPAQSALGALLAILVAVAGFRALRTRRSGGMWLFVLTAIIVALTQPAVPPIGAVLRPIRELFIDPVTTGGLRGLLLGVALGSIVVGLRLLVGADKPQSD
ncbi:MAG: hypothetical protein ACRDGG_05065 [Anaerolineae bacterium]